MEEFNADNIKRLYYEVILRILYQGQTNDREIGRNNTECISQWRCLYCKLNLPDIFASIESPHHQTSKVKILAAVGFPKRRYSIFNVFIAYVMYP
jgi:hypothetical protein